MIFIETSAFDRTTPYGLETVKNFQTSDDMACRTWCESLTIKIAEAISYEIETLKAATASLFEFSP